MSDQGREELGVPEGWAVTQGAQELWGGKVLEAEGRREEVCGEGEGRGGGLTRLQKACVVIEVSKHEIFGIHLQMMGLKQLKDRVEPEVQYLKLTSPVLLITLGVSAPSVLLVYLHLLQVFGVEVLKVRGDVPHQGRVHD